MSKEKVASSKGKFIRDARCTNDISWYKHYDALTKDVASVFMSKPNGTNYPDLFIDGTTTRSARSNKQGGILINKIIPWFGSTPLGRPIAGTALNTAASKLYYYVVHGNSRNVSYDKGDLMRCLMTYDGIYCALHEAIRAYKFIKYITVENKWADQILLYLGWDPVDLKNNVVQFRTQINLAIQKLNQLSLPDIFDMHKCHAEMFDYVYRDRPGEKSQYIANVPAGYWMFFDEFSSLDCVTQYQSNGSIVNVAGNGRTVADFTNYINFMIHTIYDSTDMGVMQGDIRKAFSDKSFITMYMLEEDNEVPVVFDEEFNLKVHNMEIFGNIGTHTFVPTLEPGITSVTSKGVIHDQISGDPNMFAVVCSGVYVNSGHRTPTFVDGVHIMDLPDDYRQDVDCVLLMQTLKVAGADLDRINWHLGDGTTQQVIFPNAGAAIVEAAYYYGDIYAGVNDYFKISHYIQDASLIDTPTNTVNSLDKLQMLWDMAITLTEPIAVNDGSVSHRLKAPMEIEDVTVYSNSVLDNILNVIIESLWYASELYNGTT